MTRQQPTTPQPLTYAQIAEKLDCTRQRVMQIEAAALKKLRHRLRQAA